MIDVKVFASSINLTWIRRLITNKKWQHIIMTDACINIKKIIII